MTALGQVPVTAPTALTPTRYGGARAAFFLRTGGRELVYTAHSRHGLIQVAEYARRPLLVDALRSGHTYAAITPDRRTIGVYATGRSATQRR